ncbi:MAG: hypothetical protein NTZ10_01240 [Candidatus Saganbacteria bacterium]|nr:hypothetical protein [Candidatus Saganbacteria bacterium]
MKRLLFGLLVCLILVAAASAEIMMTACPLGQGKWNVMLGSMVDQNYFNMGSTDVMWMDAVGYGINDRLDLYGSIGLGYSQKATDQARTMNSMTMSSIGVAAKYTLLSEDLKMPLSLAVNAGIRTCNMSMATMTNTQYNTGLVASKMIKQFTPYAGVNYRTTKQAYGDYTQMDYTIGMGIGPMERMFMIEDTLQYINFGSSAWQSNQISAGFCFNLN